MKTLKAKYEIFIKYFSNKSYKQKLIYIMILGLIVRFAVMPFFMHDDLAACYWRVYNMLFRGKGNNFFSWKILLNSIHGANLYIINLIIPNLGEMMSPKGISVVYYYPDYVAFNNAFKQFLSSHNIYLLTYLFKIPYLIFDIISAFFITKFFKSKKNKLKYFLIWWFNPINIFVTYIWGRYDSIMCTFLLMSLYYLSKNSIIKSTIFIILGLFIKPSLILLVPFFILYFLGKKNFSINKKVAVFVFISLFSFILLFLTPIRNYISKNIISSEHFKYLFQLNYSVNHYLFSTDKHIIYIYPLFYLLLFFKSLYKSKYTFSSLLANILAIFLGYYVLCYFHPHYFIWFIPIIILLMQKYKETLSLHIFQLIPFSIKFILPILINFFIPFRSDTIEHSFFTDLINSSTFDLISRVCILVLVSINTFMIYSIYKNITSVEESDKLMFS